MYAAAAPDQATAPGAAPVERRAFTLHPQLLRTLILEQASGLEAALRELIMNAVDAGATEIHVSLDRGGFEVRDDGCGMGTREDVLQNFECFGRPQEGIPKPFGRYRLGRAQILGFSAVSWSSGPLRLTADFTAGAADRSKSDEMGLACDAWLPADATFEYDLIDSASTIDGTVVTGRFHRPLSADLLKRLVHLALGVQYATVPVYLNGRQVSTPPTSCDWSFEDEVAWYLLDDAERKAHAGLLVYNQGVFVQQVDASATGCTGIVVSKVPLELTIGRDAVTDCRAWVRICDRLARHLHSLVDNTRLLGRSEAVRLLRLLSGRDAVAPALAGSLIRSTYAAQLLQGLNGKRHSLEALSSQSVTFYDGVNAQVAETAEKRGMCVVLRTEELLESFDHWGVRNFDLMELYSADIVGELYANIPWRCHRPKIIPFRQVLNALRDLGEEVPESTLPPEAKIGLEVMRHAAAFWAGPQRRAPQYRTIHPARSDTMLAWTDGLSTIHFRVQLLSAVCASFEGLNKALLVLAHELAHNSPSRGQTAHDAAFYERFHDIVQGWRFLDMSVRAQAHLLRLLGQRQVQTRSGLGAHVDAITTLGGALKRKRRKPGRQPSPS